MKKRIIVSSFFLSLTYSTPALAASVCLQNFYTGDIYNGRGVSFRVRACDSADNCSGWGSWDWLQRGRKRVVRHPDGGSIQVEVNTDGDNRLRTRRNVSAYFDREEPLCDGFDSWSFGESSSGRIWMWPGRPADW